MVRVAPTAPNSPSIPEGKAEPSEAAVIERCAKVVSEVLTERAAYFQRTKGHWDRDDQARSYIATAAEVDKAIRALSTSVKP